MKLLLVEDDGVTIDAIKLCMEVYEPSSQVVSAGSGQDAGEGTDFHAIAADRVSITPLQVDLTRYAQMEAVTAWLTNP